MGQKNKKKQETKTTKGLYGSQAIATNQLERWPNPTPDTPYETQMSFPEFTCLCPRSGYPDFAVIRIRLRPAGYIVELKSLKLYLNSFRDVPISHEESTATIYRDLKELLNPHFLEVVGDFNVRGNLKTVITFHSEMTHTPPKG
jgi:7-cyano-7-deazaguanine reductase